MLSIVNAPNDILSKKAQPVEKVDKNIMHLINEMEAALASAKDPEGVGLAAPQVGKSIQIFIIKESPTAKTKVFINPKLTIPPEPQQDTPASSATKTKKRKKKKGVKLEGCLSLKDIWGQVDRHPTVHLTYLDGTGKKHEQTFAGFYATIIQHEYDHLQGILFPKHVLEQKHQLYKSLKDEHGETVFEEIQI